MGHDWLWLDLAQHHSRLWPSFRQCALRLGVADYLEESVISRAERALLAWKSGEVPELLKLSIPTPEARPNTPLKLEAKWNRVKAGEPLERIPPLD